MKKILLGFIAVLILHVSGLAQNSIRGKVFDKETSEPLPYCNISIKNQNKGAVTDVNGEFEMVGIEGKSLTITASFVGYQKQTRTVTVSGNSVPEVVFYLKSSSITSAPVVITGTRTERRIEDVPTRVNLITPKRITASPAQSADELLNYTAGVNVNRAGGFLSHRSNVSMRGMSGAEQSRVLILVDGIPVNKADGGSVNWNLINMETVKKVEVSKGPGSSLYGSNAMGGVVNIITSKPTKQIEGSVKTEYGEMNTYGGRANVGGRIANTGLYYGVNAFYRQSDGYNNLPEEERDSTSIKSDLMEYAAGIKIGYDLNSKNNIELSLNYFDDQRGSGSKIFIPEGERMDHDTYTGSVSYKGEFAGIRTTTTAYYRNENYFKLRESYKASKDKYTCFAVDSKREDLGLIYYASKKIGKRNDITAGFDVKQGKVDAVDDYTYTNEYWTGEPVTDLVFNRGSMNTMALFIQDEITLSKSIKLIAGLRFDHAKFFDGSYYIEDTTKATDVLADLENKELAEFNWNALSPKLSAQYRITKNIRTYVSYAQGFRPPVLDDLCRSGFIRGGFKRANPELKPETIQNFEWGMDWHSFDNKLRVSPSAYYSLGKDFMYYVSTGDSIAMGSKVKPIRERRNISGVEIYGAEMEINFAINKNITALANYAYTHSTVSEFETTESKNDISGNFLTYVPEHQFTIGAIWTNRYINTNIYYHHKGEFYADDQNEVLIEPYATFDVKLWRNIGENFSVAFIVKDALDNQAIVDEDYLSMGRYMKIELGYRF